MLKARDTWSAAVHGVAKSQTWLSNWKTETTWYFEGKAIWTYILLVAVIYRISCYFPLSSNSLPPRYSPYLPPTPLLLTWFQHSDSPSKKNFGLWVPDLLILCTFLFQSTLAISFCGKILDLVFLRMGWTYWWSQQKKCSINDSFLFSFSPLHLFFKLKEFEVTLFSVYYST